MYATNQMHIYTDINRQASLYQSYVTLRKQKVFDIQKVAAPC